MAGPMFVSALIPTAWKQCTQCISELPVSNVTAPEDNEEAGKEGKAPAFSPPVACMLSALEMSKALGL